MSVNIDTLFHCQRWHPLLQGSHDSCCRSCHFHRSQHQIGQFWDFSEWKVWPFLVKEKTLMIQNLNPTLNVNVGSEKLCLYWLPYNNITLWLSYKLFTSKGKGKVHITSTSLLSFSFWIDADRPSLLMMYFATYKTSNFQNTAYVS